MGTIGLILSIFVCALLYSRKTIAETSAVPFVLLSTVIFSLGGTIVWLMLILPFLSAWFEAIFRLKRTNPRPTLWVALILLPSAIALPLLAFDLIQLPMRFITTQAAIMLALDLKLYAAPEWGGSFKLLHSEIISFTFAAVVSFAAIYFGSRYWLEIHEPIGYLYAITFGVVAVVSLVHKMLLHPRLAELNAKLDVKITTAIITAAIMWVFIILNLPEELELFYIWIT
jgi:hypothetical protein